ncbi:MAG: sulfatase, partial [Bacteroidales bacterium]|nr:sulfatase [Candidatus Cacconaster equifaecalis]
MTGVVLSSVSPLFISCSASNEQEGRERDSKPLNIVFIMCDDHSYQTISSYDDRFTETPNIDRIGREGARFTNSFVANSLSGPSRACLLTGKHSHKNGFTNNEHGVFDGSQQTVQQLLRENGYTTAMVGKWHLVSEPTGFDYWNILTGQGDYYNPVFIDNGQRKVMRGYCTNITTDIALEWLESGRDTTKPFCLFLHHKAPHRTWMPDLCDLGLYDDVTYPLPDNFYDDYRGRQAAALQEMSIIKDMNVVYDLKMADREGEIHTPENKDLESYGRGMYLQAGDGSFRPGRMDAQQQAVWDAYYQPLIQKFKRDSLTGDALSEWKYQRYMHDYCSVIHSIDRNVGRVYDYLAEHGLLENTVVIYTSDQGFFMGEHGYFDKRFMYEESFRTPLLVRMPDCTDTPVRGGDIEGFVQNIDHAATFLEFAGVEIPSDIQGVSYAGLLRGEKPSHRPLYYHYYEYP